MEHTAKKKSFKLEEDWRNFSQVTPAPITVVCPGILSKNLSKKLKHARKGFSKDFSFHSFSTDVRRSQVSLSHQSQGTFELHLLEFELTDYGIKEFQTIQPENIKFWWNFYTFERSVTAISYNKDCFQFPINQFTKYNITYDFRFFEYLFTLGIIFELCVTKGKNETTLATGILQLKKILENPASHINKNVEFCSVDKSGNSGTVGNLVSYGVLSVIFCITCEFDIHQNFIKKYGRMYYNINKDDIASIYNYDSGPKYSITSSNDSRSIEMQYSDSTVLISENTGDSNANSFINSLEPTDSETDDFQEALTLVLSRNKALRTTQNEITSELQDRTNWMHEESNWQRTLQEYSILQGKDPNDVDWRQWREENTAHVKLRIYSSEITFYKPEVTIKIFYLKFKTNPPRFKQFYVEYNFLSYDGIEMESPYVETSEDNHKMYLNFTKTFHIDDTRNSKLLSEAIKNYDDITFTIVGEPTDLQGYPPCCEKVCECFLNLFQLVQEEVNELSLLLPLFLSKNEVNGACLGYLKVSVTGIQAMRMQALKTLAPSKYSVY